MKWKLMIAVIAAALPAVAYDITIKCDTQYPDTPLRTLPLAQGFVGTVQAKAIQNGIVNTNISGDTARIRIGTSATAASFITATSTVTTVSSGTFTIPISPAQSNTNGTFWYSILFYDGATGPYYAGTGTCTIAATTASGATSAPSLLIPLNLSGYDITGTIPLANLSGITSNQMAPETVAAFLTGEGGSATNVALADLTDTMSNNYFAVGDGTNLVLESPTDARTSLGLGTAATNAATVFATAAQGVAATNALTQLAVETNRAIQAEAALYPRSNPSNYVDAAGASNAAAAVVAPYTNGATLGTTSLQPADTNGWIVTDTTYTGGTNIDVNGTNINLDAAAVASLALADAAMPTNGGRFGGAVFSDAASATSGPEADEFVTAGFVRALQLQGAAYYFTATATNDTFAGKVATTNSAVMSLTLPAAKFTNAVATAGSDTYLAAGIITNGFTALHFPMTFLVYADLEGGNPASIIPHKMEIYYRYQGTTNLLGDWESSEQNITPTSPSSYTHVIYANDPTITGTVDVIAMLKSGTVAGAAAGLNIYGGATTPSALSIEGVSGQSATEVAADLATHEGLDADAAHGELDPDYSAWVTNSAAGSTNAILPDGTLTNIAALLGGGVTDHGALTGLDDDDHTNYVTHAEGAAAYLALAGGTMSGNLTITNTSPSITLDDPDVVEGDMVMSWAPPGVLSFGPGSVTLSAYQFSGSGAGLTSLPASNLVGNIAMARMTNAFKVAVNIGTWADDQVLKYDAAAGVITNEADATSAASQLSTQVLVSASTVYVGNYEVEKLTLTNAATLLATNTLRRWTTLWLMTGTNNCIFTNGVTYALTAPSGTTNLYSIGPYPGGGGKLVIGGGE